MMRGKATRCLSIVFLVLFAVALVGCERPPSDPPTPSAPTVAPEVRRVAAVTATPGYTNTPIPPTATIVREPAAGPTPFILPSGDPLPGFSLEYKGKAITGIRGESCWGRKGEGEPECTGVGRTWPEIKADVFTEVSPDQWVTVGIMPGMVKSPDRLFAHVAEAGGGTTSDLKRLVPGPNGRVFKLDFPPGKYHVRIIGYWDGDGVEATGMFSLEIPGRVTLEGVCEVTLIGGDLDIVLDSQDDPMRTAYDALNSAGCGFNLAIIEVRLILGNYTEIFRIEPPRQRIGFPLGGDAQSVVTGGPLATGEYKRRVVAVSDDGQEWELTVSDQGGFKNTVTLAEGEQ